MSVDGSVEDPNTREHLLQRLRDLLNEALAYEEYKDGASIQQLVMQVLDTNPGTVFAIIP